MNKNGQLANLSQTQDDYIRTKTLFSYITKIKSNFKYYSSKVRSLAFFFL